MYQLGQMNKFDWSAWNDLRLKGDNIFKATSSNGDNFFQLT